MLEQVVVQEELGKLTNALWDCVWRPANALRACTPEQRERWLAPGIRGERRDAVAITEAEAGSDPSGIATTATRDGDGWRIDGEKWFVTVGDVADYLLVLADAPTAARRCSSSTRTCPASVVRRTPAYTHTFVFEHPEFGFEGVRVGPEALLGEVGGGYELTRDWFTEERLMIGARTIGAADARAGARHRVGARAAPGRRAAARPPADPGHARRQRDRDRGEPRAHPPGRRGSSTAAATARRCTRRRRW